MNLTHEQLVIFALALIAAISVGWATSATVKGGRDWDEYCSLAGYRIFTFPGDHFSVVADHSCQPRSAMPGTVER